MAYTIEQKPNQLAGANSPMVYVLKESDGAITGANKFRYIAQVDTGLDNSIEPTELDICTSIYKYNRCVYLGRKG